MDPPPPPVDRLSSLPEHLQDEILNCLDLRDAVRASARSRAWRRRWETLAGLALSFPDGTPAWVIYSVLLRYAGPSVSRFAIHVDARAPASHVDDWLVALSRRRVESISIFNDDGGSGEILPLHSSILACDRLVSLRLERCCIPPFPQPQPQAVGGGFAAGFPVLKELYLTSVDFPDSGESQLWAIIRASPLLRVLLLEDVYAANHADRVFDIEVPNLHTLGIVSCQFEWEFGDLPRLQRASIHTPDYYPCGSLATFVDILAGISKVQELSLNLPPYYYGMGPILFTFYNLKSLELSADISDKANVLFMFCLLRSSPNLEKLKIELQESETVAQKFLRAQWTDGLCANLKVVQITSYEGWLPLYFIKLILSKCSLLRTLSVDACPVSQDDRLNELLTCRRASPQAQVLFQVQLEGIRFDRMKFPEKGLN